MGGPYTAAGLLWFLVFVYAVAGSVDFGATFWRMFYLRKGQHEAAGVAERYVSPLWEATNVFLVLIGVVLVGFFPGATFAMGTLLLWPGAAALILLAIRGAALGFAYAGGGLADVLPYVSGATAILLPALLVSMLTVSQGGFTSAGGAGLVLDFGLLLHSAREYAYVGFALAAVLFLSATFLADYAKTARSHSAYRVYRVNALWLGPVMMLAGVAAIFLGPSDSWLLPRLRAEWPWFLGSLLAFCAALPVWWWPGRNSAGPVAPGRPRLAVLLAALQFSLADIGYGLAHAPYILFPQVTTVAAFSNQAMFRDLLWVTVLGLAILVPGFVWLWRLFITDPRYTRG